MIHLPVPTGTVLLVQMTLYEFKLSMTVSTTASTALKLALPFLPWGVPTAIKIKSELLITSSMFEEKNNLLLSTFLVTKLFKPGS